MSIAAYHVTWSPRKLWISTSIFNLWSEVWIRIRILSFPHKGVEQTEIMLAKYGKILTQNFSKKLNAGG
jgi:hypothetical protein